LGFLARSTIDADGLGFAAVAGPTLIACIRQTTGHYTGALDVIAA
jgi:hypothetical protein